MGFLSRIATRLGYTKAADAQTPAWLRATADAERDSIPDGERAEQQVRFYQKLSWVAMSVSILAQTAAGTPFSVRRRVDEGMEDIINHPFELRLQRPNPLQSRFEFLEATFAYRALTGNAYWWLNRVNEHTEPDELWIIPTHRMQPVPDGRMFIRGYRYDAGQGDPILLEPWEVLHFKRFHPLSSYVGLSPLEALAVVATGDLKMQVWNTNFFGKDNAKIPGALAFADPISDTDWARMKSDVERQHGGTQRRLMMLRNVGKGGVEWISMAMSQRDMEFLNARQFTKEEIFATFAPGLASLLAINATEANSMAGKATFYEMSIWPTHVAIGEKITNNLLPVYGSDLVGAFDDVRIKDRTLELQERTAYERTHTVDEVRKRYDNDGPLGDDRGKLLLAEVGKGLTTAVPPAPTTPDAAFGEMDIPRPTADVDLLTDEPTDTDMVVIEGTAGDLAKWERKALKRLRAGRVPACTFASDVISDTEARGIYRRLLHATDAASIKAAFKRAPGEGLSDDEQVLFDRIRALLEQRSGDVAAAIEAGALPPLELLTADLRAALTAILSARISERMVELAADLGQTANGIGAAAQRWATTYSTGLAGDLAETTRQQVEQAISQYRATPGMTREDLLVLLRPAFGIQRAEMIAITEITRAAAQAATQYQAYLQRAGIVMEMVWHTAADDRTCPVCGPRDGRPQGDSWDAPPPAHPRCRCGVTLRLKR